MDSARFLLAIVLMIAVIVITNLLFPPARSPQPESAATDTLRADTAATPEAPAAAPPQAVLPPATTGAPQPLAPPAAAPAPPAPPAPPSADTVFAQTPLYRYGFSTRGAALVWAELLAFASLTREGAVQLVPPDAPALLSYRLQVDDQIVELAALPFEPRPAHNFLVSPAAAAPSLTFTYDAPASDFAVEITYTFRADNYLVDVSGRVSGIGERTARLLLDFGPTLAVNEADAREDYRSLAYVVNSRETGIRSVSLGKIDAQRVEEGPLLWVGLKNKYFVAALIGVGEGVTRYFGGLIARDAATDHAAHLTATLPLTRERDFALALYLGPQEYERLAALGQRLEDVNPYGWRVMQPILRPLAHFITWALVGMRSLLGVGYGWVLILFGIIVRVVLWPLNARAMRAQLKNMELQPKLKEIQEKYKNDPERLQKEMVRLYKEEGFNPLGGCLPMLIPFPVLIALFFVFQSTIEFRGVEFLWLPDLARKDPYYILPLVLGGSMVLLQWMSSRSAPALNPQMKMMMWFMPIFMVVIFLNLASGLNLYYAASNIATVPQQLLLTRERQRRQAQKAGTTVRR